MDCPKAKNPVLQELTNSYAKVKLRFSMHLFASMRKIQLLFWSDMASQVYHQSQKLYFV